MARTYHIEVQFVDGSAKKYTRKFENATELLGWMLARPYVRTPHTYALDGGEARPWATLTDTPPPVPTGPAPEKPKASEKAAPKGKGKTTTKKAATKPASKSPRSAHKADVEARKAAEKAKPGYNVDAIIDRLRYHDQMMQELTAQLAEAIKAA